LEIEHVLQGAIKGLIKERQGQIERREGRREKHKTLRVELKEERKGEVPILPRGWGKKNLKEGYLQ